MSIDQPSPKPGAPVRTPLSDATPTEMTTASTDVYRGVEPTPDHHRPANPEPPPAGALADDGAPGVPAQGDDAATHDAPADEGALESLGRAISAPVLKSGENEDLPATRTGSR